MKEMISILYEYGIWANGRLLAKAAQLSTNQLTERLTKGAEPVLPTFGHLVGADIRWLARWQEQAPPAVSPADFPTLEIVRQRWDDLSAKRRAYIAGLDDRSLHEAISWPGAQDSTKIPRWQAMVHCATMAHSTEASSPQC